MPLSVGNIGLVARTGEPHISRDVRTDPSYRGCFGNVRSEVVVPVRTNNHTVGIVDVEAAEGVCIDVKEVDAFAAQIARLL